MILLASSETWQKSIKWAFSSSLFKDPLRSKKLYLYYIMNFIKINFYLWHKVNYYYIVDRSICLLYYIHMQYDKAKPKKTHQGNRKSCKKSSMNKSKKRSFKPYRAQGR